MKSPILLLTLLFVACGTNNSNNDDEAKAPFKVKYKGALKEIMHKGDVTAKANLNDIKNIPNLYALGAIENLKGEVQIFNSQPFNTQVVDSALVVDKSFHNKAALLVYASVEKWKTIAIPDEVVSKKQLERYIEATAKENQIDTDEPFPFLLEGTAKSFDWHVINWKEGDTEHSHEKHIASGLHGTIKNRPVQMLGFYSDSHHAIFTHHTTNMHIHVKTTDENIAGHVDDLVLGEGMMLKLPETNEKQ